MNGGNEKKIDKNLVLERGDYMQIFGFGKKREIAVEEVVVSEGGKRCDYCLGHGQIMVTYDGDVGTCPKCDGRGITNRIVKYIKYR